MPRFRSERARTLFALLATSLIVGTLILSVLALVVLLRVQQDPEAFFQASHASPATLNQPTPPGIYLENGGLVMRIDPTTGRVRWLYQLDLMKQPDTQLTQADSIVSVSRNTVFVETRTGGVYALEASTGALRWQSDVAGQLDITRTSRAETRGDELYVAGENAIYALRLSDGSLARTIITRGIREFTLDGDMLYVAGSGTLAAYSLPAGALRWQAQVQGVQPLTQPHRVGDMLFSVSPSKETSTLYAFDVSTGRVKWQIGQVGEVRDASVAGGVVYAGATSKGITAYVASDGKLLWQSGDIGFTGKAPQVEGAQVYVTGNLASDETGTPRAHSVFSLAIETGHINWVYTPQTRVAIDSVSVQHGKIYVDRENGIDVLDTQGKLLLSARSRGGAQYTAIVVVA
ncbi:PQQ-like beta-propeller repeat protein [Ktedonobacter robiniae]|uniref:Pyrrolo-quinoline quinone repeat domain-containing protein n=1 Tax=Ktedonobacter robiniae TaxID=2778365 RepID=A0ABQ3US82_9CHLR|nr:PQQ-like beta-propeller repeat protein [Ktedonobacter robiniae]GHO55552.1 hypothetical protein KSB_40270 [Ktedonobacter robiniae]